MKNGGGDVTAALEREWSICTSSISAPGVDDPASESSGLPTIMGSGGLSSTMESTPISECLVHLAHIYRTSFRLGSSRFESCLLEWPPFKILLIPSTGNTPFMALLACRLRFVAFQPFCFTGNAT